MYDTKLNLMVILYSRNLGNVEYPYITNTLMSTLMWIGSTSYIPLFDSNRRTFQSLTEKYY